MNLKLFCATLLCVFLAFPALGAEPVAAEVSVCFTPGQNCEAEIVNKITAAKRTIRVQAYYLTSTTILGALRSAIRRGVKVEAILDRVNARKKNASANYLVLAGATVWIDQSVTIAHSKVMIIDESQVIGGSFNFTKSAQERNAENVTFMEGRSIADEFLTNWNARLLVATQYKP